MIAVTQNINKTNGINKKPAVLSQRKIPPVSFDFMVYLILLMFFVTESERLSVCSAC